MARCQRNDSEQKTYSQMIDHRFLDYNRNEQIAMLYDPGELHGQFFNRIKFLRVLSKTKAWHIVSQKHVKVVNTSAPFLLYLKSFE